MNVQRFPKGHIDPEVANCHSLVEILKERITRKNIVEETLFLRLLGLINTAFRTPFYDTVHEAIDDTLMKATQNGKFPVKELFMNVFLYVRDIDRPQRFSLEYGLPDGYQEFENDLLRSHVICLSYMSDGSDESEEY